MESVLLPSFTIENLFSLEDDDPDQTAEIIEKEIGEIVQKTIQNEKPSNIFVIENKGWNLYQPYIKKLVGFHPITRIKPFHYSKTPRLLLYASINPNNDTVLLTDAVKCGTEINGILTGKLFRLLYSQKRITKVVGYLATHEGLDNIQEKNPDILMNFVKIVDSIQEYENEQKRMRLVYQNRMEPIDGEHPYVLLRTETKDVRIEDVKSIIRSAIPDFYSGNYEFTDNHLKIRNKKSFTVHFHNPESFNMNLKEYSKNTFNFEKIALRFKFSTGDSSLRIMGIAMTDDKWTLINSAYRILKGKCDQNFPYNACQMYNPLRQLNILRSSFCPMCIDNNISRYLISGILESAGKSPVFTQINWKISEVYSGV